ncbi:MAG TPA: hypothetical protein VHY20_05400, partial [Pirellulales bacterium]|nr:hypothetical protein [Pirellulales bacterium]
QDPWMGATWFCLLRSAGLSGIGLCAAYVALALPAAIAVARQAWRRGGSIWDLLALACWAAPLVAPYARYYDLTLMLIPLVVLARRLNDSQRALLLAIFMIVPAAAWIVYPGEVPPLVSQLEWIWLPLALAAFWLAAQRNSSTAVMGAAHSAGIDEAGPDTPLPVGIAQRQEALDSVLTEA